MSSFLRGTFHPACGEYLGAIISCFLVYEMNRELLFATSSASPLRGVAVVIHCDNQNLINAMGPKQQWPSEDEGRHLQPLVEYLRQYSFTIQGSCHLHHISFEKADRQVWQAKRADQLARHTLRFWRGRPLFANPEAMTGITHPSSTPLISHPNVHHTPEPPWGYQCFQSFRLCEQILVQKREVHERARADQERKRAQRGLPPLPPKRRKKRPQRRR